ncbi:site-specific integrase [Pseudosulfitobacter koreensis]|uniref:Tyrosine-type recombinase/integrase n=1 Tax=Pseudosulfitobacter koreensis TaxID=2968472 RepID=A0ABT1YZG1_9RHOB|nr:site-specific integrase [Pseudosulfitobacter koreense]MCR8826275.1 tyrosine-type recombinase/integrase [Pseudosulfitobacter koreense]
MPVWRNGDWEYDRYIGGKRFRRRLGIRDESYKELAIELSRRDFEKAWEQILNPVPTFAEAALLYMKHTGNRRYLKRIIAYFGKNTRIDQLDEPRILRAAAAIADRRSKETGKMWQPSTIKCQAIAPIKAVINFIKGTRRERRARRVRDIYLTPAEVEALIKMAQTPEKAGVHDKHHRLLKIIVFMVATGCGPGETFAVNVEDFNWSTNEVYIPAVEDGAGKTLFRARWVHLPDKAIALIGELPKSGRAFLSSRGNPIPLRDHGGGQIAKQFRKLCRAAGLPDAVVPYTLRHTWATFFSAQVGDHDRLLDQGGWGNSDTARDYRKKYPADLAEQLDAFGWDFRRET